MPIRWLLFYLSCNLNCDSPILEALWFTFPSKTTGEIWDALSQKSADIENNEDLIQILRTILRDSHWDVQNIEPTSFEARPNSKKDERIVVDYRTSITIIEQIENFEFSFSITGGTDGHLDMLMATESENTSDGDLIAHFKNLLLTLN